MTDPFNAREFTITLPFPEDGYYNVTAEATNSIGSQDADSVVFNKVGMVKGLKIDDNKEITSKHVPKWFYLDFEVLPQGTCVKVS